MADVFMEILDCLEANVAMVDRNGTIVYVNESWKRFAVENGDPALEGTGLGVNYLGVCKEAARDDPTLIPMIESIEGVIQGKGDYFVEYPCHSPDRKRWFMLWAKPLRRETLGAVFFHVDVTEKVLAQERLKQLNDELEEEVRERTASLTESNSRLREALAELRSLKEALERENIVLRESIKTERDYPGIVGHSPAMAEVLHKVSQVAVTDAPVLIVGETGTGKELIAKAVHELSPRRDKVMIKVNCASLPPQLIESELFGHEKGAYTHAFTRRLGRFEIADGSSLFLDEIGDLPVELQPKLLRVLQDGEFERVGSSTSIRADVRVIAATNRDLQKAINEGRFREDLWYRLNVFPIRVPPLRERKEDLPDLVFHFLSIYNKRLGKSVEFVPPESMKALELYTWPGNVRELENLIHRAVIVSHGKSLILDMPQADSPKADTALSLEEAERRHIENVLKYCSGRIEGRGGAADVLKMNPSTLRSRMKKLGINRQGRA